MTEAESVRFGPGDKVRVRVATPPTHIRTPVYVQGKTGRVDAVYGAFHNPESRAYGGTGTPKQPLYRIEFAQTDLWDNYRGPADDKLLIDIYQHWLDSAD
jgi:hypothetical protein